MIPTTREQLITEIQNLFSADRTKERESKFVLCEICQEYHPVSDISDEGDEEPIGWGVWDDGKTGPIGICKPCWGEISADFD